MLTKSKRQLKGRIQTKDRVLFLSMLLLTRSHFQRHPLRQILGTQTMLQPIPPPRNHPAFVKSRSLQLKHTRIVLLAPRTALEFSSTPSCLVGCWLYQKSSFRTIEPMTWQLSSMQAVCQHSWPMEVDFPL